ncbi:uncharacterized protein LOC144378824 [Halichoerus grypus]
MAAAAAARSREPASAPARARAPASARGRSGGAAAGAALPAPGVSGCAAAGRVNEARRRGRRRRRRRRRRCGDWDAPWSPAARSLWAGPETPPLPRPSPPPPPTWFQRCEQAGPAGGREGAGRAEREVFTSQKLLQAPSSLMERNIVWQVARVVRSSRGFVCHPWKAVSSSTATTGKCITYQVTESAGGHLFLPQDLRRKSTGLGVFAVQSRYELARRHNASPFYSGPP